MATVEDAKKMEGTLPSPTRITTDIPLLPIHNYRLFHQIDDDGNA